MEQNPVGMILCAGFGTRLQPLTFMRPKPIMELATKPIVYYLIKMLENAGIKDVVLNLYYQSEQVRKSLAGFSFKSRLHFVYEKNILGTAGGIKNACEKLALHNRSMVLLHGDILCDLDLMPFLQNEDFCQLICDEDRQVDGYVGSVGSNKNGDIVELGRFYQGQTAQRRGFFTGIHFLSKEAVKLIQQDDASNLVAEIYPRWLKEGRTIKAVMMPLTYYDLGSPQRLFAANLSALEGDINLVHVPLLDGMRAFGNRIYVGQDVSIDERAHIKPPVMIAHRACIEAHATVGPYVIIGEYAVVSEHAQLQKSVVMSKTIVEKYERLDCAIALNGARVLVNS